VLTFTIKDSPAVAQAWLVGVNPKLGDRVPIRLLRESTLDQVAGPIVGAARVFADLSGERLALDRLLSVPEHALHLGPGTSVTTR
jgi:hypothetical protein